MHEFLQGTGPVHCPPMNDTTTLADPPAATVTDEVRLALEDDIRQGRLRPGDALDVKAVAERFGISRTPAKEALLQLAAAGLMHFSPRRGAVVTRLEPREVFGMLEVLAVLEAEAARLSARRMSNEQRQALVAVQSAKVIHRNPCSFDGRFIAYLLGCFFVQRRPLYSRMSKPQ